MSKQTFEFEIPDNMSRDEMWPYIFSQMFTHFDNDCTWGGSKTFHETPTYAKIIALKVVKATCMANIESMEEVMGVKP